MLVLCRSEAENKQGKGTKTVNTFIMNHCNRYFSMMLEIPNQ